MQFSKTIVYLYQYYLNPGLGKSKYILPTHVNFPITDNCNSKCRMCNVWKDKSENELTPSEIKKLFSDRLFKNVNHIGISGGEPTLRNDLIECIIALLDELPKLQSLSITSHGFHPTKWQKLLPDIISLCKERKVFFKLNISVDGIGELHEEVRRIEGGWKKVLKTIRVAKENNCPLQIQCTVSKHNVFGVNEVLHFARKNNIEFIFRKATSINRLYNSKITTEFFTSNQEDSFFSDFLKSKSVNEATDNPGRRLIYKDIAKRLVEGTTREAPCHFQNNGVLISAHGEMFHCSIDETPLGNCKESTPHEIYFSDHSKLQLEKLIENVCPACIHDQSGSWSPYLLIKEVISSKFNVLKTLTSYTDFAFKNIRFHLGLYKRKVQIVNSSDYQRKLHIIGAYGGEHVGDSAILGGVILRQKERYPDLKEIIVYSKRPDRTIFWKKGLDFNPKIEIYVKDYTALNKISLLKGDVLTWAGGPIMEMPVDLFEHYVTIKSITSKGIKFEIMGCGWGPFKTAYSMSLANKIIRKASFVQMRDDYSLKVAFDLKRDPAFDYLYTQKNIDNEGWSWQKHKIDDFLKKIKNTGNKKIVLINLRPLWSKYNKSKKSSEDIDREVLHIIFETIKKSPKDYTFISVPFNTDHYGFSDMIPALQLKDICIEAGIDNYFVFDREIDAREMIYFLKFFDAGICMRFHACIFMKSLNIPVFGIDYTAGETGKVGGLFKSFNDSNYSNILRLESDEIIKFVSKI